MKKKLYIGSNTCCDEEIIGIVAYSSKEALNFCRDFEGFSFCDSPFLNARVKWDKTVKVDDLPVGEVDYYEGVKKGIYAYVYGVECDVCKEYAEEGNKAHFVNNKVMCEECESKIL